MSMLVLTRKAGEKIRIGDNITITVCELEGNKVRIAIEAPRHIRILRNELVDYLKPQMVPDESDVDLEAKPREWQDVKPTYVVNR
jgi:carbon storage regulator CsrA